MSNIIKFSDARDRRRGKVPHHADVLSFMKRRKPRGTGINYWAVKPSGNYSRDYETGRARERISSLYWSISHERQRHSPK